MYIFDRKAALHIVQQQSVNGFAVQTVHSDNEKVSDTYLMHTFYGVRAVHFRRALNTHKGTSRR